MNMDSIFYEPYLRKSNHIRSVDILGKMFASSCLLRILQCQKTPFQNNHHFCKHNNLSCCSHQRNQRPLLPASILAYVRHPYTLVESRDHNHLKQKKCRSVKDISSWKKGRILIQPDI